MAKQEKKEKSVANMDQNSIRRAVKIKQQAASRKGKNGSTSGSFATFKEIKVERRERYQQRKQNLEFGQKVLVRIYEWLDEADAKGFVRVHPADEVSRQAIRELKVTDDYRYGITEVAGTYIIAKMKKAA